MTTESVLSRLKAYLSSTSDVTLYEGHPAVLVNEAVGEIERLGRHVEALQNKIDPDENCACAFDAPDDVCIRHSPQVHALTADRDAARSVYLTLQQSSAVVVKKLEATERNRDMWKEQVAQQAKRQELFSVFLTFVNRWTWGNDHTEAGALSCIQHHPILTDWRKSLLPKDEAK